MISRSNLPALKGILKYFLLLSALGWLQYIVFQIFEKNFLACLESNIFEEKLISGYNYEQFYEMGHP